MDSYVLYGQYEGVHAKRLFLLLFLWYDEAMKKGQPARGGPKRSSNEEKENGS